MNAEAGPAEARRGEAQTREHLKAIPMERRCNLPAGRIEPAEFVSGIARSVASFCELAARVAPGSLRHGWQW